jgi:hypothetical protein
MRPREIDTDICLRLFDTHAPVHVIRFDSQYGETKASMATPSQSSTNNSMPNADDYLELLRVPDIIASCGAWLMTPAERTSEECPLSLPQGLPFGHLPRLNSACF